MKLRLMKTWLNLVTNVVDAGLITLAFITGPGSIAELKGGTTLSVGIALSETSLPFSLATEIN